VTPATAFAFAALAGYLLGGVPFGLLVARARGVDLRAVGSGNIGATNVARACGRGLGALVFLLDAAKGFAPAFFLPPLLLAGRPDLEVPLRAAAGLAAIGGHVWPVYLRLRGGKGVAAGLGALVAVAPHAALAAALAWLLALALWRYVSLASMVAAGAGLMAALGTAAGLGWDLARATAAAFCGLALLVVLARHRANLKRLVRGEEPRAFSRRKETAEGGVS
jgi:glycerol-3-phosphate acyltransferase PlsY